MIVLDSDHLSILQHPESSQYERLVQALNNSVDQDISTTVVSLEEQMRGWLAAISRARDVTNQPKYYSRLAKLVDFYSRWHILEFDDKAAEQFTEYRTSGIRIGAMDLKIAAITTTTGGTLISANLRDFEKVPELKVESWLD